MNELFFLLHCGLNSKDFYPLAWDETNGWREVTDIRSATIINNKNSAEKSMFRSYE